MNKKGIVTSFRQYTWENNGKNIEMCYVEGVYQSGNNYIQFSQSLKKEQVKIYNQLSIVNITFDLYSKKGQMLAKIVKIEEIKKLTIEV